MEILAADIGGTHARFMVMEFDEEGRLRARLRERYRSSDLAAKPEGLRRLIEMMVDRVDAASFAVAGAVSHGEAVLTNLDWHITRADLVTAVGTERVRLLNDFEATGYVLPFLREGDYVVIQGDGSEKRGARALLGAGTGLGQALVVPGEGRCGPSVHATEGGHVSYAPRTELEWELRVYLQELHGHVSWERVLSGSGIRAIYDFLVETGELTEDPVTRREMSAADPASVIVDKALDDADPICARALDMFVDAYGARAGDVALSTGATGGVYLAGGIASVLRNRLRDGQFLRAFLDKGRMSNWLEQIPVRVIVREDAGTAGAAIAALDPADRGRITALPGSGGHT